MTQKRFLCLAEDEAGNKYSGSFEAENEEAARKMVTDQGFKIVSLTEEADPSANFSKSDPKSWGNVNADRFAKVYNTLPPKKRRPRLLNEILSYVMPLGAALIALAGIPIVVSYITPPPAEVKPPCEIIREFYGTERIGDFAAQFRLFSPAKQRRLGPEEAYVAGRKKKIFSREKGTLKKIEPLSENKMSAVLVADLFRPTGLARVEFALKRVRGRWRIYSIRDPDVVLAYLPRLDEAGDDNVRRELTREIKAKTDYTDLEIEAFLEDYQKEQRARKQKDSGIEYFFDVT